MTRPGYLLRDAALGYASRGIPVLPLHYPVAHLDSARVLGDGQVIASQVGTGCSCGDRACGQVGKHPLGSLVPHGLKEATTNRARVLAWWTRHPLANIGLACGHVFDVLDLDGPDAVAALRAVATRYHISLPAGGRSSGPAASRRAGITTWPPPAWAAATAFWIGSTSRAEGPMWSPHPAAMPPAAPTAGSETWSIGCRRCRRPSARSWSATAASS
jgi:hypothetical protein